jgi:hypothetical protein
MDFFSLIGSWVTFDAERASIELCVPMPGYQRFAGEVIDVKPMPNLEPGSIPTALITVKGRTGKKASFCFTSHHTKVFRSMPDAVRDTQTEAITYEDIKAPVGNGKGTGKRKPKPAASSRKPAIVR